MYCTKQSLVLEADYTKVPGVNTKAPSADYPNLLCSRSILKVLESTYLLWNQNRIRLSNQHSDYLCAIQVI